MYRVGIIGLGFMGMESPDSHYKAYQDCTETDLVAMCDLDESKMSRCSYDYRRGFHRFDRYAEMVWMSKLDIVSVCTPVETHCQIVCDIAPHVKSINCEKPIATTLEEAEKMIATCHQYGVILQINHQRRYKKPVMMWSRGLLNNGSHAFDLVRQIGAVGNIEMRYIDSEEYIFQMDIFTEPSTERLTRKGVEHLVDCLDNGRQSISSGEEALETLRQVLEYARNK